MHLRNKLEGEKKHILCELAERVSFSTFELQYIYIYLETGYTYCGKGENWTALPRTVLSPLGFHKWINYVLAPNCP